MKRITADIRPFIQNHGEACENPHGKPRKQMTGKGNEAKYFGSVAESFLRIKQKPSSQKDGGNLLNYGGERTAEQTNRLP